MEVSRRNKENSHLAPESRQAEILSPQSPPASTIKMYLCWRIILAFMGFFFFMAAFVQFNDPDPYIWIIAYIIPCILSLILSVSKIDMTTASSSTVNSSLPPEPAAANLSLKDINPGPSSSTSSRAVTATRVKIDKKSPGSSAGKQNLQTRSHKGQTSATSLTSGTWTTCFAKFINFNTIILVHIIYCFSLGFWTLFLFTTGITSQREIITKFKSPITSKKIVRYQYANHGGGVEQTSNSDDDAVLIQMEMNAEEAKEIFGLCLVLAWLALLRNYNFLRIGKLGLWLGGILTAIPFIAWILVELYEKDLEKIC